MDKMELKALGKINLGLDVLGRRENGYHFQKKGSLYNERRKKGICKA